MEIHESLLSRLKNQHEAINAIISGAEAKIFLHPQPEKWSIHDNIAHLARYQPVFMERINSILKNHEPAFERYSAETDSEFESWRKRETGSLMQTLSEDRKKLFEMINGIPVNELNRIGIHPRFGRLSITKWTEFFVLHEAHHMFTMFQIANTK